MDRMIDQWKKQQEQKLWEQARTQTTAASTAAPLTAILAAVDVLQDAADDCTPEERRDCLEVIRSNSMKLYRFIRNVEDAAFGQLDAGNPEVVHPEPLLQEISRQVQPRLRRVGCTLAQRFDETPHLISIDRQILLRILGNLIANAVNASEVGDTVTLFLENQPDGVRIGVEDCGCGMSAQMLDLILNAQDTARSTGLRGCRMLLDAMGTKLCAQSAVGKGSRFWFELPACDSSAVLGFNVWNLQIECADGLPVLDVELSVLAPRQKNEEADAEL